MESFTYNGKTYQIDASQEAYRVHEAVSTALWPVRDTFRSIAHWEAVTDRIALDILARTSRA